MIEFIHLVIHKGGCYQVEIPRQHDWKVQMRLIALALMILMNISSVAFAQGQTGVDYTQEYKTEEAFKAALKANDKMAVANLISYPVEMSYPLPSVNNADEFVSNWDDFFDKDSIDAILKSKSEPVGSKGLLLDSGIWIVNGKVNAPQGTSSLLKKLQEARKKEALSLHASLHGYDSLVASCDTEKKHIRIQSHADGYHYFVWDKKSPLTEKPELSLKGDVEHQGTMGGEVYTFVNGNYSYVFDAPRLCEEECQNSLAVLKDDKEISKQVCK